MNRYIALRVRKLPVIHWFVDSGELPLTERTQVLIRTQHGSEIAAVARILPEGRTVEIPGEPFVKEILRTPDGKDKETLREISRREIDAFRKTRDLIHQHKLNMKLLKAEYLFDFTRLILYYKAENKVDFRELLKSLASTFKTRIELRQIGVRDETKLLGGIGCCGKMVCCAQFMATFHPVSTKMAKDQNLSMNPAKLSGICCRLLCCISHEHEYYASFHGKFPRIGADILYENEKAKVMDLNYITQKGLLGCSDRRKIHISLSSIKGKKDPDSGRNLWWVQEPGKPEPDLSILLQPSTIPSQHSSHASAVGESSYPPTPVEPLKTIKNRKPESEDEPPPIEDDPRTDTPPMAFSGYTPPRGDNPETHAPSMAFSGYTPPRGDKTVLSQKLEEPVETKDGGEGTPSEVASNKPGEPSNVSPVIDKKQKAPHAQPEIKNLSEPENLREGPPQAQQDMVPPGTRSVPVKDGKSVPGKPEMSYPGGKRGSGRPPFHGHPKNRDKQENRKK